MAPRNIYTVTIDGAPEPIYQGSSKGEAAKILLQEQAGKPAGAVHLNIEQRPSTVAPKTDLAIQGKALRKLISAAMKEPNVDTANLIEGGIARFTELVKEQAKA